VLYGNYLCHWVYTPNDYAIADKYIQNSSMRWPWYLH